MSVRVDGLMVATVVTVAAIAFLYYKRGAIIAAVDPTSDQNLAYQGANGLLHYFTGNPVDTVGTWLYDATHPGEQSAAGTVAQVLH